MKKIILPPGCGKTVNETLLHNNKQQQFQAARRLRFCLKCRTTGSMHPNGQFTCAKCGTPHTDNLTAPRVWDHFLLLAGRGGGKTLIGAHAVREELLIPGSVWWVMGPNHKWLHDSTKPTLLGLIPPEWVKRWDGEHDELTLVNDSMVAFRSLEDPERARGPHGVAGLWFDEAAQCPERAYDVATPMLMTANGIVIATTTVFGFDWTYERLEKPAEIYKEKGYFFKKWWTEENPLYVKNETMRRKVEQARRTMAPEFFAQEYRSERRNATGLVYDYQTIERLHLANDDSIKRFISEWDPAVGLRSINAERPVLIGLDSGTDHPFGATLTVVTEQGLVDIDEYLERQRAITQALDAIAVRFCVTHWKNLQWSANKNEANLRLEGGLKGIGIIPAESKHEVGIQRMASWLHTGQTHTTYRTPRLKDQLQMYRYAVNVQPDGQKKAKEAVWKEKDELPDAKRYSVMAWPHLPDPELPQMTDRERERWDAMPDRVKLDVERVRERRKAEKSVELEPMEPSYPVGDFFANSY